MIQGSKKNILLEVIIKGDVRDNDFGFQSR